MAVAYSKMLAQTMDIDIRNNHWLLPFLLQELSLDGFISHEVAFENINKAFDYLQEGKSLRCIIRMDH